MAELIANSIGIKNAHIDIGEYNGDIGCFSYNFLEIRIDGKNKRKPMHIEVVKYLKLNYYEETYEFVENVLNILNKEKIEEIIDEVKEYISIERKNMLVKFLEKKIEDLKNIYEM